MFMGYLSGSNRSLRREYTGHKKQVEKFGTGYSNSEENIKSWWAPQPWDFNRKTSEELKYYTWWKRMVEEFPIMEEQKK